MMRHAFLWGTVLAITLTSACSSKGKRTTSEPDRLTETPVRTDVLAPVRTDVLAPVRTDVPTPLRPYLEAWHRFRQGWARKATVWFIGTYGQGSYPCSPGPGGSLDMIQQNYLSVTRVLKGNVAVKTVDLNPHPRRDETLPPCLVEGRRYLVLLKPDPASLSRLGNAGTVFTLHTMIARTEIVAIVDLSQGKREAIAEQVKATRTGSHGSFTFTPAKWNALRRAQTADIGKQKPFLAFIENVVINSDATERRVRSYLGSPDTMRRSGSGAYTCAYQLNLKAHRKPSHGAVYTELRLRFGPEGKVLQYRIEFFRWSVSKRSSTSTALTDQELKRLGLERVKRSFVHVDPR